MRRKLLLIAVAVATAAFFALPEGLSFAKSKAVKPGNNGTIKIDGIPWDSAPDNQPHPGCTFQVDFYNYDQGSLFADLEFVGIAPTGGGTLAAQTTPAEPVMIGDDVATGGTDLDATVYASLADALSGIAPHAQQGWHVKLTIHADGSQGADVKHKVFWIECAAAGGAPGGGGGGGAGGGGAGGGAPGGGGGGGGAAGPTTGGGAGAAGAKKAPAAKAVKAQPIFTG